MNNRLIHGWKVALAAGAVALAVVGCAESDASEAEASDDSDVAVVERGDLDIRVEASGIVEPILVVEVKSKASGEVTDLYVDTGDQVERGALLAEVDPRDVRNTYAQAEADLDVAQARLQIAQSQAERSRELREANVVTQQEMETSVLDAANARAQLIKARTNLELAQEKLGDVTIRAPINGTIISKSVEAGTIIASASGNVSGGTTLMQMADLSEMQVRTLVDETDIGKVQPGQTARVQVEAYPNQTFVGSVLKIEPQAVVDQNVTMFPVLVRLDNREGLLKPNMNAEVQVEVAQRNDVLLVPNAAVVGMQDARAAAEVLGVGDDAFSQAMAAGPRAPASAAPAGEGPARDSAQEQGTQVAAAEGGASQPDCQALMAKARADRSSLTEEERSQLRPCFQQRGGFGRARRGGSDGDTRMGFVFIQTPQGPEPRQVVLGLNDWDKSQVVSGVEEGEQVILVSVARLRQQQEDMLNRFRERSSPIPGGGR